MDCFRGMRYGLIGVVVAVEVIFSGCAAQRQAQLPAQHTLEEFTGGKVVTSPFDVYDPIEGFNRGVYRFNYYFDSYLLSPVVRAYEAITPDYVENRISNFFDNIFEINNLANCLLMLKPGCVGTTLSRIAINSTVGIGGLWDPAAEFGFRRENKDFGQTLGYYGVGNGPYIVLPLLGPSNARDTVGFAADSATIHLLMATIFDETLLPETVFNSMNAVDRRHRYKSGYFESGSPFEYELIRMLYTKYRQTTVRKLDEE